MVLTQSRLKTMLPSLIYDDPDLKLFILVGLDLASCILLDQTQFNFFQIFSDVVWHPGTLFRQSAHYIRESSFLIEQSGHHSLFVCP